MIAPRSEFLGYYLSSVHEMLGASIASVCGMLFEMWLFRYALGAPWVRLLVAPQRRGADCLSST